MTIKLKIHSPSCESRNDYVTPNCDGYPVFDYNLSFPESKFSRMYGDTFLFEVKFLVWMK